LGKFERENLGGKFGLGVGKIVLRKSLGKEFYPRKEIFRRVLLDSPHCIV